MTRRYHRDAESGTQITITIMGWVVAIVLGATGVTVLIMESIRLIIWTGKAIR